MRLPNSAHEGHPWAISEIASDFKLLDVWQLPVEGGPDGFEGFLGQLASFNPAESGPLVSRFLFWVRFRLGELFGWDDPDQERPIPGCTETSLRERLPEDLRPSSESGPAVNLFMQRAAGGFSPLYLTEDEWAAEISNGTVHGVLHVGWVHQGGDIYRPQLGIYVKPRGLIGEVYMKFIEPFRHLVIYPAMMREMERKWDDRALTT
jgi:hypothetical protein